MSSPAARTGIPAAAFLLAYAESGQGVVIMINGNDNSGAVRRMVDAVRRDYHWPDPP